MTTHQPESDPFFLALYEHQMTSTLRDSCTCGAGDMDTLYESGTAIQRHRRHVALVLRKIARRYEADAWDEAKWATYSAEREGRDGSALINPHRFTPGTTEAEVCTCGAWDDRRLAHAPDCAALVLPPAASGASDG